MSYFGEKDVLLEISKGKVAGHTAGFIVGGSQLVQTTQSCTVWDLGGNYVRAESNTQYYLSSTDPLDTAVTVQVDGVDENSVPFVATATSNGQNQVALNIPTTMDINVTVVTGNISAVGDLFIAELDTLAGGKPITASKIKAMIPLARKTFDTIIDTGTEFASDGISHLGIYHVAAGHTCFFRSAIMYTAKNHDIELSGRVKFDGGPWLNRSPADIYQNGTSQDFNMWLTLPEKTRFEGRAIAGALANSVAHFQFQFVLVDNTFLS